VNKKEEDISGIHSSSLQSNTFKNLKNYQEGANGCLCKQKIFCCLDKITMATRKVSHSVVKMDGQDIDDE
jgi:hypothetical protein